MQDELKKNGKSQKSISKWVNANGKNMSKKRTNDKSFSNQKNTKYSFKIRFQNKIKQMKKNANLLQNTLTYVKKERLFEKGLKKMAKMQNLSLNEFNQIAGMHGQSRDEFERIAKIRRIKNYEEMTKEELIISLLKSKQSITELFNNNLYDNKISDIRRILNRLRDILPRKYKKEIKEKLYEINIRKIFQKKMMNILEN